ncbi:MAG: metallophosphoesterase [Bdellovibrionaceae bacterium]|nr:metallophosphoesterase [Pseudobdellovibrionaceae bacterium]
MITIWVLAALFFLLSGCGVDTPFGSQTKTSVENHNHETIQELVAQGAGKTGLIRIGLLADSHQNYKGLEEAIDRLNTQNLDFVIHLGDFTNIGLNVEFDAFVRTMGQLRHPYVVLIGNHDAIGAGIPMYRKIFGEFNTSFSYAGRKIVLYNSNSLEFQKVEGFDPQWAAQELASATEPTYLFQHVNYDNKTHFTDAESADFEAMMLAAPDLRFALNGHLHAGTQRNLGSIRLATIPRSEGGQYAILELDPAKDSLSFCEGSRCQEVSVGPGSGF